jgi:hypothetical protein
MELQDEVTPAGEGSILRAAYERLDLHSYPADIVQSLIDAYEALYPMLI